MKHTRRITKKAISLLCAVTLLVSALNVFPFSASAYCEDLSYDCNRTVTLTVKTGKKSPSIKFVCTAASEQGHRCSKAPQMKITVSPSVKGKSTYYIIDRYDLTPRSISSTLRLEENRVYTVTISYYANKVNLCSKDDSCRVNVHDMIQDYPCGHPRDQYADGEWSIAKMKNCSVTVLKVR